MDPIQDQGADKDSPIAPPGGARDEFVPFSIDAERALLGALLLDPRAFDRISEKISPASFYLSEHQRIYQAIVSLNMNDGAVDPITVSEAMTRLSGANSGPESQRAAMAYLTALYTETPSSASIEHYAKIVSEKRFRREIIAVGNDLVKFALQPSDKEAEELLNEAESRLYQLSQSNVRDAGLVHIQQSVAQLIEDLQQEQDRLDQGLEVNAISGASTGFKELDERLDGLQPGSLVILAARPSMGKTSLALNIAEHFGIASEEAVAVFSLEMPSKDITRRMISSQAQVQSKLIRAERKIESPSDVQRQGLSDLEWARVSKAIKDVAQANIHIDDSASIGANEIRSRSRKLARKNGRIGLIIIDYLQLVAPPEGKRFDTNALAVGENTRAFKALAKELNCPVIALSQLNRDLEKRPNKRPTMSDLRDSGAIEQDADVILFIYRDEVYNPDSMDAGTAEIIIGKQRNGPIGTVRLNFVNYCTRFEDPLY